MVPNQDIRLKYASKHISNVVFYIPFAYYCIVRLGTFPKFLSWALIYIFPTFFYSTLNYHGAWLPFIVNYFLILLAVFSVYELGYILNDTTTINREKSPTIRLYEHNFLHFQYNRHWIILIRIFYCVIALVGLIIHFKLQTLNLNPQQLGITCCAIAIILPIFVLYNHWRNRYNVWLYPILVFSRYLPFVLLYDIHWLTILFLFLAFPLPNMIERFSMPRYRFPIMRILIPTEQSKTTFRACYYIVLLLAIIPLVLFSLLDYQYSIPIILLGLYRIALYCITKFYHPRNYLNG